MDNKPLVHILMSTYNGERYVKEQIYSILNQEDVRVVLHVKDDCSSDGTARLIEEIAQSDPRIQFGVNASNTGVAMNFLDALYELSCEPDAYVAFSDQDDIWDAGKLAKAVSSLKNKKDVPALYYSGVRNFGFGVSKNKVNELASFKNAVTKPDTLLFDNWAYGCTMVFNCELLKLIKEKPVSSIPRIHDVWVHMIAYYCDAFIYADLDNSYISRRIHENNAAGLIEVDAVSFVKSSSRLKRSTGHPASNMAAIFLEHYREYIAPNKAEMLNLVANYNQNLLYKIKLLISNQFYQPSMSRYIKMRLKILLGRY